MLISKTKKVFIITFNAPNKEREKLIFCVRFLMRYCENAETEASFIIYRKVSNNNYFLFLILRSITIYLNIIQCVLFIDIGWKGVEGIDNYCGNFCSIKLVLSIVLFSFFRRNILLWMSAHVTADHTGLYH